MKVPGPGLALLIFGLLFCLVPFQGSTQEVSRPAVITTENLKSLHESGKEFLLIDCLTQNSYNREHIAGAKHFEFPNETMKDWNSWKTGGKSEREFIDLLGPDKERPLVFYCLDRK